MPKNFNVLKWMDFSRNLNLKNYYESFYIKHTYKCLSCSFILVWKKWQLHWPLNRFISVLFSLCVKSFFAQWSMLVWLTKSIVIETLEVVLALEKDCFYWLRLIDVSGLKEQIDMEKWCLFGHTEYWVCFHRDTIIWYKSFLLYFPSVMFLRHLIFHTYPFYQSRSCLMNSCFVSPIRFPFKFYSG